MNRFSRILGQTRIACAATMLAAMVAPSIALAAQILKYSDHEPLGGMRTHFLKDVLFPAIEKESNGRLKVEDHWNGEIATGYDAMRAIVEKRTTDMAIVVPEYVPNNLPLHQLFKSYPIGPTGAKQVEFFRRVYAEIPAFPDELGRNNVVNVLSATGYPVAFFSTSAVAKLDDIKGGKWRSASFWHHDFLRNAGAIPVTIPWGEGVYKALEARTLDGLMVNVDSGYLLKVHETAPHVLVSKDQWLGHVYLLAMHKDTWNRLADEDRQAIQRASETAYKSLGAIMDASFDSQVEDLKAGKAQVRVLNMAEASQWATLTKYRDVQAAWVGDQERKGLAGARAALESLDALMADVMR